MRPFRIYLSFSMKKKKQINGLLTLKDISYALDGGSLLLEGVDSKGSVWAFELVQRMSLDEPDINNIPGRLYLNDTLVALRSQQEKDIIKKLKEAQIDEEIIHPSHKSKGILRLFWKRQNPSIEPLPTYGNIDISNMRDEIVKFVESEEYLEVANVVERNSAK